MPNEYQISEKSRRVLMVIFKAVATLLALGFSVWLAWYEFGAELLTSRTFLFMMVVWFVLGLTFFFHQLDEATQKTTSDKIDTLTSTIDDLITELRQDRNERTNKDKQ